MKETSFNYSKIALCGDCGGTGLVDDGSLLRKRKVKCLTCNGTGRVVKRHRNNRTLQRTGAGLKAQKKASTTCAKALLRPKSLQSY